MSGHLTAAAVDLGASSGRVLLGRVGGGRLEVEELHRFAHQPVRRSGLLCWDHESLWDGVLSGLRQAASAGATSVGVDSWAVDYGLLDSTGRLLPPVVSYRDDRTDGVADRVRTMVGDEQLYAVTGLQFLPFNTIYQLLSESEQRLREAHTMLLVPDLVVHRLTGAIGAERTNASTTGLYDVTGGRWAEDLVARLGLPARILPPLREPGEDVGPLLPAVADEVGAGMRVTTVASHDTASAVAAVPAEGSHFAFISCGTWSLVGVELDAPVLTEPSRLANFTNEIGVDGTVRYLRNVMGLWLLQESVRSWRGAGLGADLPGLLAAAAREPGASAVVDAESEEFLAPGDMPARIETALRRTGQPVPTSPAGLVRCILDSLALAHARSVRLAVELSGHAVEVVHLVGGGSRNELLCQLTADACGLPVVAGPAEASGLGNLLVQARAAGVVADRAEGRALVRASEVLRTYRPRPGVDWAGLHDRLQGAVPTG